MPIKHMNVKLDGRHGAIRWVDDRGQAQVRAVRLCELLPSWGFEQPAKGKAVGISISGTTRWPGDSIWHRVLKA